jgi:hypothetical protein
MGRSMKRELWTGGFGEQYCPAWPCPSCKTGTLALDRKSLVCHETRESKAARSHDGWDPDWITYNFTAWTDCGTCKGKVAVSGTGGVTQEYTGEHGEWEWMKEFKAKYWSPMPDMIDLPSGCPDDVKSAICSAFTLHAIDRAACAGRLRVALEELMAHQGVPAKRKTTKGTYADLNLHSRLTEYAKSEPEIGAQLMALKWLGNAGSHESEVGLNDLLDAFEVLEDAIGEIIGQRKKRVAKLVKSLTRKFGKPAFGAKVKSPSAKP